MVTGEQLEGIESAGGEPLQLLTDRVRRLGVTCQYGERVSDAVLSRVASLHGAVACERIRPDAAWFRCLRLPAAQAVGEVRVGDVLQFVSFAQHPSRLPFDAVVAEQHAHAIHGLGIRIVRAVGLHAPEREVCRMRGEGLHLHVEVDAEVRLRVAVRAHGPEA